MKSASIKTTLKLGNHRGNLRLWIEGKALAALFPGDLITVRYSSGQVLIVAGNAETATNRITRRSSGAAIIDINSAKLSESLGEKCERVNVIGKAGKLTITINDQA